MSTTPRVAQTWRTELAKRWAGVATAALIVILMSGCVDDFHDPTGRNRNIPDPKPAETTPDPTPVAFDVGDCLRVDLETVGPLFEGVVPCEDVHEAQVYLIRPVAEGFGMAVIAQECHEALRPAFQDPSEGRSYALTSPINYVYNQGPVNYGDQMLCVYIHAVPRTGAANLSDAEVEIVRPAFTPSPDPEPSPEPES